MTKQIKPPHYQKDAIMDRQGWRHPKTNELLHARQFSAEDVAAYNKTEPKEVKPKVVPAPKPEIKIEEPKPEIKIEEPKPEIKIEEPKPEVKKTSSKKSTKRKTSAKK